MTGLVGGEKFLLLSKEKVDDDSLSHLQIHKFFSCRQTDKVNIKNNSL